MDMQEDYNVAWKKLQNIEYLLRIQNRQDEANDVKILATSLQQIMEKWKDHKVSV